MDVVELAERPVDADKVLFSSFGHVETGDCALDRLRVVEIRSSRETVEEFDS